jgi:hypothetical protein
MWYVCLGITNDDWFDYLPRNQIADEVNFSGSSALPHKNIESGIPWLQRLQRNHRRPSLSGIDREMVGQ